MERARASSTRSSRFLRLLQLALLACVGLLAGCNPHYTPPLMVGTNTWIGYEPLYLARSLGYHDGLPLRLVELGSTTQAMDALRVGKLDLAGVTLDEALTLVQEGLPLRIIWVMDVSAGADAIIARPGIRHLADLRGQRIGVEQTAVGAYMLQAALEQAGMQASDVSVVPLPLDEHLSAWHGRRVDAVVTFDPVRQTLLNEGGVTVFDSRALPGEIVDVLVARDEALQCCARRIAQLLDGQRRALAYLAEHRDDALARMAQRPGVASADMAAALNGMVLPDATGNRALLDGASPGLVRTAQQLAQTMHQHGLLARIPGTTGLVDGRFVREMQP